MQKLFKTEMREGAAASSGHFVQYVLSHLCSVECVLCSAVVSALTLCTLCFTMFIVHCSEDPAGSSDALGKGIKRVLCIPETILQP